MNARVGRFHFWAGRNYEPLDHPTFELLLSIGSGTHRPGRYVFGFQVASPLTNPCLELYVGFGAVEFYCDVDGSWDE